VVVFTRTKRRARNLAADLEDKRYRVAELQGNMAQNRRQEAIHGFRTGKYDILVATDIAARGIDVSEITHVINFDMPDTVDAYTHRIGRTGRAEQTGDAFTFVTPGDELMVRDIEKVLGKRIERRKLANFDYGDFAVESRGARTRGNASPGKDRRPDQRRAGQAPASRQHAQMPPPVGEGVAEINVAGYHRSHGEQPHVQPPNVAAQRLHEPRHAAPPAAQSAERESALTRAMAARRRRRKEHRTHSVG
jgi:superfamily II DNA/RNA helicase